MLSKSDVVFLLDVEIERIGDLLDRDLSDFLATAPSGVTATNLERT